MARPSNPNPRRGTEHPSARLTASQVTNIRQTYSEGHTTYLRLSEEYDVAPGTISAILRGRTWTHLPHTVTPGPPRKLPDRCKADHEFSEGNTRVRPNGHRECRTCSNRRKSEWRKRNRKKAY